MAFGSALRIAIRERKTMKRRKVTHDGKKNNEGEEIEGCCKDCTRPNMGGSNDDGELQGRGRGDGE